MKEIALMGTASKVYADVLTALLHNDVSVYAMTENPEKMMLDDTRLTTGLYDYANTDRMAESLEGYHTLVVAYNDDLTDAATDDIALRYFDNTVKAAMKAGVARLGVVASPQSEAFFAGNLRRNDKIDWVFISTEGDFADRAVAEVVRPTCHKEVYAE